MDVNNSHRFGVIRIPRTFWAHVFNIMISAILMYIIYDHSQMKAFPPYLYRYAAFFIGLVLVISGRCENKKRALLTIVMLVCFMTSTIVHFESELVSELCLIFAIALFFLTKEEFFDDFVIGACISFLPFLYIYIRNVIVRHYTPTNHAAIGIAITGFLLVSFLYRKGVRFTILFFIEICLTALNVVFGSRTSLVAGVVGFDILAYYYMKNNKKSNKTILLSMIGIVAVVVGVFVFYDQIYAILFLKWGHHSYEGNGNIFVQTMKASTRMAMWKEVFRSFSLFGFPSNYVLQTFGYNNVHNGYIQAYVSYGLISGVVYLTWIISVIITGIKSHQDRFIQGHLLFLFPVLVFGILESNFILDPEYQFIGLELLMTCGQLCIRNRNGSHDLANGDLKL